MTWTRLAVLAFVVSLFTSIAAHAWVAETVDSDGDVGSYTSIAMDSLDYVHISYYDATNDDLKYATNASGSWVTTLVDASGSWVGGLNSLALDSLNYLHITYNGSGFLTVATNALGSWVTTTVDSHRAVGVSSIALDSSDYLHISYEGDLALKYATNATGNWVTTTVDHLVQRPGDLGHNLRIGSPIMRELLHSHSALLLHIPVHTRFDRFQRVSCTGGTRPAHGAASSSYVERQSLSYSYG
jgi:hypothetical protein